MNPARLAHEARARLELLDELEERGDLDRDAVRWHLRRLCERVVCDLEHVADVDQDRSDE